MTDRISPLEWTDDYAAFRTAIFYHLIDDAAAAQLPTAHARRQRAGRLMNWYDEYIEESFSVANTSTFTAASILHFSTHKG